MKGHILIELVLWLSFLIPGLLYSIWRHTTVSEVCPSCSSSTMVPLDTPIGQKLASEFGDITNTSSTSNAETYSEYKEKYNARKEEEEAKA